MCRIPSAGDYFSYRNSGVFRSLRIAVGGIEHEACGFAARPLTAERTTLMSAVLYMVDLDVSWTGERQTDSRQTESQP